MAIEITSSGPERGDADALLIGARAGEDGLRLENQNTLDPELESGLRDYLGRAGFKGKLGQLSLVPTLGRGPAPVIAVVGLGKRAPDARAIRRAVGAGIRRLGEHRIVATDLHALVDGGSAAVAEGALLGSYRFDRYKSEGSDRKTEAVILLNGDEDAIARGRTYAEAALLARDLINEPPDALTPGALAERARAMAGSSGLDCEVLDDRGLRERGLNGVWDVGKGSDEPPVFITLRYSPSNASGKVALVGKGVTFDSGGLSLKDAKNMEDMKTDMSGAAAVIGTMSALSALAPALEVHAFIPSVENMPGNRAIKPGDVITHYGGRTTEVLNTDAEGRLILADALALASEGAPGAIIDVATLTGSIMVALGRKITGLFANDDDLAEELLEAAGRAGEDIWRMPLYEAYDKQLESEIADRKNIGTRWGGSIVAAMFLKSFVGEGIPWAHLDIAGSARSESDDDEITKGGTGVATRTLLEWLEGRARESGN